MYFFRRFLDERFFASLEQSSSPRRIYCFLLMTDCSHTSTCGNSSIVHRRCELLLPSLLFSLIPCFIEVNHLLFFVSKPLIFPIFIQSLLYFFLTLLDNLFLFRCQRCFSPEAAPKPKPIKTLAASCVPTPCC